MFVHPPRSKRPRTHDRPREVLESFGGEIVPHGARLTRSRGTNRVIILFTPVGNEADRIGLS
jgi:hypothetical protein